MFVDAIELYMFHALSIILQSSVWYRNHNNKFVWKSNNSKYYEYSSFYCIKYYIK